MKMEFLDVPRHMVPLPSHYFEVVLVNRVVGLVIVVMNR